MQLRLQASAVSSTAAGGHPNRSAFSGVLCRVGVPSDAAPNGSGGRRVVITAEAARRALSSLINMGVNVAPDLGSHNPTNKIGCITGARIAGNAILIEGVLWFGDHPNAATRIAAAEASLGFSFEACVSAVENMRSDPLVVTECTFTGAALIRQSLAAFRSPAITLAPKIQENQMTPDLRLAAGAAVFVDSIQATASNPLAIPRPFLRALTAAAITGPADIDRLDEAQLARLLQDKTPEQRMGLKQAVLAAGLYPRTMPTFGPIGR